MFIVLLDQTLLGRCISGDGELQGGTEQQHPKHSPGFRLRHLIAQGVRGDMGC